MVIIGSDHAGIDLKKEIIDYLYKSQIDYADVTNLKNQDGDDYPDVAKSVCINVLKDKNNIGIAICGTGVGISIACNKIRGIRAANCTNMQMAELAKKHNNANVLCLGARLEFAQKFENVKSVVDTFINTFYEKGRHERRLVKINELEEMNIKGGKGYGSSI